MSPLRWLKIQKATVPQNLNYLIDRNMQENKKFMKSRVSFPILFYPGNSERWQIQSSCKKYFKDGLMNLQISLSQNNAEAWRLEGLKAKVGMLFCQIPTGSWNKIHFFKRAQSKYCQAPRSKSHPDSLSQGQFGDKFLPRHRAGRSWGTGRQKQHQELHSHSWFHFLILFFC